MILLSIRDGKGSHLWKTGSSLTSQTQIFRLALTSHLKIICKQWKKTPNQPEAAELSTIVGFFWFFFPLSYTHLRIKHGTVSLRATVFSHVLQTPWCKGPCPSNRSKGKSFCEHSKALHFLKKHRLYLKLWLVMIYKTMLIITDDNGGF